MKFSETNKSHIWAFRKRKQIPCGPFIAVMWILERGTRMKKTPNTNFVRLQAVNLTPLSTPSATPWKVHGIQSMYIYRTYIHLMLMVNVGKYTSPMDPMRMSSLIFLIDFQRNPHDQHKRRITCERSPLLLLLLLLLIWFLQKGNSWMRFSFMECLGCAFRERVDDMVGGNELLNKKRDNKGIWNRTG